MAIRWPVQFSQQARSFLQKAFIAFISGSKNISQIVISVKHCPYAHTRPGVLWSVLPKFLEQAHSKNDLTCQKPYKSLLPVPLFRIPTRRQLEYFTWISILNDSHCGSLNWDFINISVHYHVKQPVSFCFVNIINVYSVPMALKFGYYLSVTIV